MDKIVNIWTTPDFREPFCTIKVIQLTVRAQFYQKRRWKYLLEPTHSMGWDITMLTNTYSLSQRRAWWSDPVDYVCQYNLSSKLNICLSRLIAFIGQDQMSGMCDLVWARIFFPQISGDRIFFPDIHGCKNFFQNYTPLKIFFSVQKFFPPGISLQKLVSFEISLWDTFLLKPPIPYPSPQKSNGRSLRASSCVPSPSWGGLRDEQKERLLG